MTPADKGAAKATRPVNAPRISTTEVDAVRRIVDAQRNSPFLQRRRRRNVQNPPQHLTNEEFWKQMVVCMCTSVQPSGPNSRVSNFVREKPFPLNLAVCESENHLRSYAERTLRSRGFRFGLKIAKQVEANLAWLRNGGWNTAQAQFRAVIHLPVGSPPSVRIAAERTASRTIMGSNGGLAGLGPKQARNLWQCLGVSQFEIPLDSRICAWINALPSSFRVSPNRLYNSLPYYEATMTHIQAICEKAEILPCEFDAAVFASADSEEWPEDDDVF